MLWVGRGRWKVGSCWGQEGQEAREKLWINEGPGQGGELGLVSSSVEGE